MNPKEQLKNHKMKDTDTIIEYIIVGALILIACFAALGVVKFVELLIKWI